jgi:hypothetical protein
MNDIILIRILIVIHNFLLCRRQRFAGLAGFAGVKLPVTLGSPEWDASPPWPGI